MSGTENPFSNREYSGSIVVRGVDLPDERDAVVTDKWHCGVCRQSYFPNCAGFDVHSKEATEMKQTGNLFLHFDVELDNWVCCTAEGMANIKAAHDSAVLEFHQNFDSLGPQTISDEELSQLPRENITIYYHAEKGLKIVPPTQAADLQPQ